MKPSLVISAKSCCGLRSWLMWQVICRGLRKACEVAVARLNTVSVKASSDDQVGLYGTWWLDI